MGATMDHISRRTLENSCPPLDSTVMSATMGKMSLRFQILFTLFLLHILPYLARGEDTGAEDITSECVAEHNRFRVGDLKHPLPPVQKDDESIAKAVNLISQSCSVPPLESSGVNNFSANIYANSAMQHPTCESATTTWYSEMMQFEGRYPGKITVHSKGATFTQLMWEGTLYIGCARTKKCQENVLICLYKPPGNIFGLAPFSEKLWAELVERGVPQSGGVPLRLGWPSALLALLISTLVTRGVY